MAFNDFMKSLARGIDRHSDVILTIAGIAGLVSTAVLVAKETPRALDILDDAKADLEKADRNNDEEAIRNIKVTAAKDLVVNYIPAEIAFALTVGCMVGSNKISRSRNAALSGALNAANIAYSEYRDRVRQTIGETKETRIYDEVRKEHIEKALPQAQIQQKIYMTGMGDTLCYIELLPGDSDTGILFYSSPEAVERAINKANSYGITNMTVSMQDLLYFLGLNIKSHGVGLIGWRIDSPDELIDIRRGSHIDDTTGKPVLDINFWNPPYANFANFG